MLKVIKNNQKASQKNVAHFLISFFIGFIYSFYKK